MIATITGIGQITESARDGKPFQAVYFKLESGSSARTYLSPGNNNYTRWKDKLKIGAKLGNLKWKNEFQKLIDADSFPELLQ